MHYFIYLWCVLFVKFEPVSNSKALIHHNHVFFVHDIIPAFVHPWHFSLIILPNCWGGYREGYFFIFHMLLCTVLGPVLWSLDLTSASQGHRILKSKASNLFIVQCQYSVDLIVTSDSQVNTHTGETFPLSALLT